MFFCPEWKNGVWQILNELINFRPAGRSRPAGRAEPSAGAENHAKHLIPLCFEAFWSRNGAETKTRSEAVLEARSLQNR